MSLPFSLTLKEQLMPTPLDKTLFRLEQALRSRPRKEEVTIFATDALRLVQLLKEAGAKSASMAVEVNRGTLRKRGNNYYREF